MPDHSRYCLCSEPDYCLRFCPPEYRRAAIEYRRVHGAPLPRDADADLNQLDYSELYHAARALNKQALSWQNFEANLTYEQAWVLARVALEAIQEVRKEDTGEKQSADSDLHFSDYGHAYVTGLVAAVLGQSELLSCIYSGDRPSFTFNFGGRQFEIIVNERQ